MKEIVNSCLSTKRFISEIPKYNHEVKNSDLRKKKNYRTVSLLHSHHCDCEIILNKV